MKKNLLISFAFVSFLFSCNISDKEELIRVAAAANLRFVMEEINVAFEKETTIRVEMVTASSGKLTAQIKSGAPYEVFLSANFKYPNILYLEGYAENAPVLFCKGSLVVWTNKKKLLEPPLVNLADPKVGKIGIANPKNAPYGMAAEELLKNIGLYDSVRTKLVYAENVSQLNQYVLNEAVDIGITAKSAIMTSKLKGVGEWKAIDTAHHKSINQYLIKLKLKKLKTVKVNQYLNFLRSPKAKSIFNKYGYSNQISF